MTKKIMIFIFGKNQKIRFKRILLFLVLIAIIIMATLNITCVYDKKTGIYFRWGPAAEIKIEKQL